MQTLHLEIFGTMYAENDRGKRYVEDYSLQHQLDTDLDDTSLIKSFVQKKLIESLLVEKFGRAKYLGWQTCDVNIVENPEVKKVPTKVKATTKKGDFSIE